jgi:hypothetical protein
MEAAPGQTTATGALANSPPRDHEDGARSTRQEYALLRTGIHAAISPRPARSSKTIFRSLFLVSM